jgi:hypothetical protein
MARVDVKHVLAVSAQAADRPGVIRLLITLSDDAPRYGQLKTPRATRPSPWFSATGPKCRVASQAPERVPASAVACVTPNVELIRVGVLVGRDDSETSVVLDRAQAKAYAESILAMCAEPADRHARVVADVQRAERDAAVVAGIVMRATETLVGRMPFCAEGNCPCGRVRAGCEYHDPTMQPR